MRSGCLARRTLGEAIEERVAAPQVGDLADEKQSGVPGLAFDQGRDHGLRRLRPAPTASAGQDSSRQFLSVVYCASGDEGLCKIPLDDSGTYLPSLRAARNVECPLRIAAVGDDQRPEAWTRLHRSAAGAGRKLRVGEVLREQLLDTVPLAQPIGCGHQAEDAMGSVVRG